MEGKGTIVYGIDPLVIRDHYEIDYLHSCAQDSPFFIGLTKGNVSKAAEMAGKYRADFYGLLKKYGLNPGDFKNERTPADA